MVKFFIQQYDIPTKKDISRLAERMDRLEKLIRATAVTSNRGRYSEDGLSPGRAKSSAAMKSTDIVYDVISKFEEGIDVEGIKTATGFNEKKIRNSIFRLHKLKKIKRKSRGIYVTS